MNPRTRRAALYSIGMIALLASVNALAHSYAGLYDWAIHHQLSGWQAMSWPAEIDVFLAVGELALYVAYLDGWPARQRVWPWATALIGLAVSVAGNVGHIAAVPGHPVILADRVTAATSPVAAFAGLSVGLLVVKMTRRLARAGDGVPVRPVLMIARAEAAGCPGVAAAAGGGPARSALRFVSVGLAGEDARLLRDGRLICREAAERGERLSQRTLARRLRGQGHRFPNDQLQYIAQSLGMAAGRAA